MIFFFLKACDDVDNEVNVDDDICSEEDNDCCDNGCCLLSNDNDSPVPDVVNLVAVDPMVLFWMRVLLVPTEDADAKVLSIALGCGMSTAAADGGGREDGGNGGATPIGGGGNPGGSGGPPE